jgi:hypothetical protein
MASSVAMLMAVVALAQFGRGPFHEYPNIPYDGQFTFVSYISPHIDEINAITLDDPALFHYPLAYIIEVDWWAMTDREASALRDYVQKGGFVIVDDFKPRRYRGGFRGDLQDALGGSYKLGVNYIIYGLTH